MSKVQGYSRMSIRTVRVTAAPGALVRSACNLTMKTSCGEFDQEAASSLLKFLVTAEHTSVLEHAFITVEIKGVSRSFLAQLTRHRMATITSASQHYSNYADMPMAVHDNHIHQLSGHLKDSVEAYVDILTSGIPKEEARQVLPNASTVEILWTVNARSLINFFRQRLCLRNVDEMVTFSVKMHAACMLWWPELFQYVGPPCHLGKCNQGAMMSPKCKGGTSDAA